MHALVSKQSSFYGELGGDIKGASYYICDAANDEDDVKNLPKTVGIGSRALCIQTGHVYVFGPSKTWVLYKGVSVIN